MPFFSGLWAKAIAALAIVGGVIAVIAKIFYEGKSSGRAEEVSKARSTVDEVRNETDAIDARPLAVDDAVKRLRERGGL